MADSLRTEQEIDTLFHEFGHYVELEARLGGENTFSARDPRLHGALAGILDADCHQGYGQIDSSCAWSEGFATFIGSVITHTMLVDAAHASLRANAGVDALPGGVVWPLDPPTSIVGPRLGEGGKRRGPILAAAGTGRVDGHVSRSGRSVTPGGQCIYPSGWRLQALVRMTLQAVRKSPADATISKPVAGLLIFQGITRVRRRRRRSA